MLEKIHPDWQPLFDAHRQLLDSIMERLQQGNFIPEADLVFRAFEFSPQHYRVLILGQDPYPNPEHAVGLAFAVPEQTRSFPPSLRNLLKELADDVAPEELTGDLTRWSAAGVMLLNRHLTTAPNQTAAHFDRGWNRFTAAAVEYLVSVREQKLVAILWGKAAEEIRPQLGSARVISSPHPSPLSAYRGFFGSRPFSACNKALLELGEKPIDWSC